VVPLFSIFQVLVNLSFCHKIVPSGNVISWRKSTLSGDSAGKVGTSPDAFAGIVGAEVRGCVGIGRGVEVGGGAMVADGVNKADCVISACIVPATSVIITNGSIVGVASGEDPHPAIRAEMHTNIHILIIFFLFMIIYLFYSFIERSAIGSNNWNKFVTLHTI
jgi:hypothetical protein